MAGGGLASLQSFGGHFRIRLLLFSLRSSSCLAIRLHPQLSCPQLPFSLPLHHLLDLLSKQGLQGGQESGKDPEISGSDLEHMEYQLNEFSP